MILVDANIPMYLVGADHPNKFRAAAAVERAVGDGDRLVADAEVLQEILHRFTAIERPEAIQPAFDVLLAVVEETCRSMSSTCTPRRTCWPVAIDSRHATHCTSR